MLRLSDRRHTRTPAVRISRTRDPASQKPHAGERSHWPPYPDQTRSISQLHRPRMLLSTSGECLHKMVRTTLTIAGASRDIEEQ